MKKKKIAENFKILNFIPNLKKTNVKDTCPIPNNCPDEPYYEYSPFR